MVTAYMVTICFANVAVSNRLNGNLYETLTHDVYGSAIEHYVEISGYRPQKIWGPITTYLDDFTTQWQL